MKKIIAVMMILTLALICPAWAEEEAEEYTCGEFTYTLNDDGTACLTGCTSFTSSIDFPDELDGHAVTSVGGSILLVNWNWENIYVNPNNPYFAQIDGVLFEKATKTLVCYPPAKENKGYVIPDGIKIIGDWAFFCCRRLTEITIPDSVTIIGGCAFSACESLTEIIIPDSVTSIGEGAFSLCTYLTEITIPDSVISIGKYAFDECPNLTITVNKDSYAEQYAKDNGLKYTYPDANDWLTQ